jgi:hypothetical protein
METSWVVLPVVDHAVTAEGDLTCIGCGGWHVDREVVVRGSGRQYWMGLHRRCEARLKKLESEELHQLYDQVTSLQERCTAQEEELMVLRAEIARLDGQECPVHGIELNRCGCGP